MASRCALDAKFGVRIPAPQPETPSFEGVFVRVRIPTASSCIEGSIWEYILRVTLIDIRMPSPFLDDLWMDDGN